jgi:ribosome production factor 2
MSLLREIKPRNARTARIVKAREPQILEDRKRTLLLHGTKCPLLVHTVLKTIHSLTKPNSTLLNKKNENIHPFEDASSLEFLAGKNDCGLVVFGSSTKKRPNSITLLRIYNGKTLDLVEMLLLPQPDAPPQQQNQKSFQVGVEMKPLILFAGSAWADTSSSTQAGIYSTLKSLLLDLFCGEEVASVDVAGLQYILIIAAPEQPQTHRTPGQEEPKPVIQLRWYKIRTLKSGTKLPRVELQPEGPSFDFRVSRSKEADAAEMKDALRRGRDPNTARTKKNVETDFVGDKLGRVHLGKQDLTELQTRKMKGLKRGREEDDDADTNGYPPGMDGEDDIDMEDGGMEVEGESEQDSDVDELLEEDAALFDDEDDEEEDVENEMPKRQKLS